MFFQNPLNNKKVDGETFLNKIRTRNSATFPVPTLGDKDSPVTYFTKSPE